jgi:outer membrane receptor for Fe3+-dicitrate
MDNLMVVAALLLTWLPANAAETSQTADLQLDTVTVVASGVSNMIAASAGDVSQAHMASQPPQRPASILENIPGLIVTQHSGEGKANQYFLRAFNLDHGTDLALEVDDMPINMPSHARICTTRRVRITLMRAISRRPVPRESGWLTKSMRARL